MVDGVGDGMKYYTPGVRTSVREHLVFRREWLLGFMGGRVESKERIGCLDAVSDQQRQRGEAVVVRGISVGCDSAARR